MNSLEGRIVGDEKLWDYMTKIFSVKSISKIKLGYFPRHLPAPLFYLHPRTQLRI